MESSGSRLPLGGKELHHTPIKLSLMIYFRRFWFRPFTATRQSERCSHPFVNSAYTGTSLAHGCFVMDRQLLDWEGRVDNLEGCAVKDISDSESLDYS
jgi:hypothetical protein